MPSYSTAWAIATPVCCKANSLHNFIILRHHYTANSGIHYTAQIRCCVTLHVWFRFGCYIYVNQTVDWEHEELSNCSPKKMSGQLLPIPDPWPFGAGLLRGPNFCLYDDCIPFWKEGDNKKILGIIQEKSHQYETTVKTFICCFRQIPLPLYWVSKRRCSLKCVMWFIQDSVSPPLH